MYENVLKACEEELEKIARIGVGVPVADLDERGRWKASIGFPYGVAIERHFPKAKVGVGPVDVHPAIGLGLTGPHIGPVFSTRKKKRKKEKRAFAIPVGKTFGQSVGRSHGWSSPKGGFATTFRSAGVEVDKKQARKTLKPLSGVKSTGTKVKVPEEVRPERNNQVNLRRGLSNIQLPDS
jgi:hypothetical protein